jgi:hypothetical protein
MEGTGAARGMRPARAQGRQARPHDSATHAVDVSIQEAAGESSGQRPRQGRAGAGHRYPVSRFRRLPGGRIRSRVIPGCAGVSRGSQLPGVCRRAAPGRRAAGHAAHPAGTVHAAPLRRNVPPPGTSRRRILRPPVAAAGRCPARCRPPPAAGGSQAAASRRPSGAPRHRTRPSRRAGNGPAGRSFGSPRAASIRPARPAAPGAAASAAGRAGTLRLRHPAISSRHAPVPAGPVSPAGPVPAGPAGPGLLSAGPVSVSGPVPAPALARPVPPGRLPAAVPVISVPASPVPAGAVPAGAVPASAGRPGAVDAIRGAAAGLARPAAGSAAAGSGATRAGAAGGTAEGRCRRAGTGRRAGHQATG